MTVRDYYDAFWGRDRSDMKKYGPFSRHCRRLIIDLIRPLSFETVLDVGCGAGMLLAELRSEFPHCSVHGIDVSGRAIGRARQRVPTGRFNVLDIAEEHLNETFDLVICSEVLEHITDDVHALDNIVRMAGEYLVITTVQGRMRRFEAQGGHVRNYKPGELARRIKETGLGVVQQIEWGFPFYSPLYRDFLELSGGKGTTGEFGPARRLISKALYSLFSLNSYSRGDEVIILARRDDVAGEAGPPRGARQEAPDQVSPAAKQS